MNLDKDDVVSVETSGLLNYPIAKLRKLEEAIVTNASSPLKHWLQDGVACEVLRVCGGGWIAGKIRIKTVLEFIPDEPSPEATDDVIGSEQDVE